MEQQLINTASPVSFFTTSIGDVQHVYLISGAQEVSKPHLKNQIVTEPDGMLRCLTIPPIYFGLDDEVVAHNITCEPGIGIYMITED